MLFVKTIRFLWPFLKEMFLGDKTLKEALRSHLGRVLIIALFLISLGLNFVLVPRLLEISYAHVALKRDHVQLQKHYNALLLQRYPNAEPLSLDPMPPPASPASTPSLASDDARKFFDRIRDKEH